ncbi:bestrophin-like domain [Vibrio sp. FJH11]
MSLSSSIDSLSIFLVLLVIFVLICLIFETGYRMARKLSRETFNQSIGPMATGLASLLAFILAITFSMAAVKSADRKQIVLTESNIIGTTVLRTSLLSEPYRSQSRELLREYVSLRIVKNNSENQYDIPEAIQRSEQIHVALWQQAVAAHETTPPALIMLYIDSLNELIDIHSERVNKGTRGRIPVSIWITLGILTFLTISLNGIQVGSQHQGRAMIAAIPFALAFSLVLTLIVELDRPNRSIIVISQQPLIDLESSLGTLIQPMNLEALSVGNE